MEYSQGGMSSSLIKTSSSDQPLPSVLKNLFAALKNITGIFTYLIFLDEQTWKANFYPELNTYGVLEGQYLSFFFINENAVITQFQHRQSINITLPLNSQITNSKNIFLIKLEKSFFPDGYLCIAFAGHSCLLIQIDLSNSETPLYSPHAPQVLNSLYSQSPSDIITVTKQSARQKNIAKQETYQFLIGTSSMEKVIEVFLQIGYEKSAAKTFQIHFRLDDQVVTEQKSGLTNKLSGFLKSTLGLSSHSEENNSILDIQEIEDIGIAISGENIIVFRKSFNSHLITINWKRDMIDLEKEQDIHIYQDMTRDNLSSKLMTTAVAEDNDKIVLFLFVGKKHLLHSSIGQSEEDTRMNIMRYSIKLQRGMSTQIMYEMNLTIIPLEKLEFQFPQKSIGFIYNYNEERQILISPVNNEQYFLIEYTPSTMSHNLVVRDFKLIGYQVNKMMEHSELHLISKNQIQIFSIDAKSAFQDINPYILNSIEEDTLVLDPDTLPSQPIKFGQITIDNLRNALMDILNDIALHLYDNVSSNKKVNEATLVANIKQLFSVKQIDEIIKELLSIIEEQLDQSVGGSIVSHVNQDQLFNDDGLIIRSLENKLKKVLVFDHFVNSLKIREFDGHRLTSYVKQQYINTKLSIALRKFQDQYYQQNINQFNGKFQQNSMNKFLINCIRECSSKIGFPQEKLNQIGTIALYVVYSKITEFQAMIFQILEIGLSIQNYRKNYQQLPENAYELVKNAALVIKHLLNEVVNENQRFMNEDNYLKGTELHYLIFQLIVFVNEGATERQNKEEFCTILCELGEIFLKFLKGVQTNDSKQSENFLEWRYSIVVFIENQIGVRKALDFAINFEAYREICREIFIGGEEFYPDLHECISHFPQFLNFSLQEMYLLEQRRIQEVAQRKGGDQNLETADKHSYGGFQMFKMFEERYNQELVRFMQNKNKHLYSILLLRQGKFLEGNDQVGSLIPQIRKVDTLAGFSEITTMSEVGVQRGSQKILDQNYQYFKAHNFLTQMLYKINAYQSNLQDITVETLNSLCDKLGEDRLTKVETYKMLFKFCLAYETTNNIHCKNTLKPENLFLEYYKIIINLDRSSFEELFKKLPDAQNDELYTEEQIQFETEHLNIYLVCKECKDEFGTCKLTDEIKREILNNFNGKEIQKTLIILFKSIDDYVSQGALQFYKGTVQELKSEEVRDVDMIEKPNSSLFDI